MKTLPSDKERGISMKYRTWILMALTVCLLCGCAPALESSSPETTASGTADATVAGGECDMVPVESAPSRRLLEAKSEIVWVNWVAVEILQPESLNPEEGEPIFRIDSMQKLTAFYEKWKSYFSFHMDWDEARSFDEKIAEYDEHFFEKNSLLIGYIWEGSSTPRFGLKEIYIEEGSKLTMEINYLNDPHVGDAAMAGWFTIAEVAKEDLVGVTEYCCIRVGVDKS